MRTPSEYYAAAPRLLHTYYDTCSFDEDELVKIIVVGDPCVGKTSFVQRYVRNTYKRDYKGTIGVDFSLKTIPWNNSHTINMQLWDIAGQERFTRMTRVYYKNAKGCIIMFDLSNRNSFKNVVKWKSDVDMKCPLSNGHPIPTVLLANKCDLPTRQVNVEEVETLFQNQGFTGWTEASVKNGLMVNETINYLMDSIVKKYEKTGTDGGELVQLMNPKKSKRKCAC